jgi:hypothetical protein
MIQGAIIGLIVGVVMMLWNRRNAQQGTGLAGEIERALEGHPPRALAEVQELVGKTGFLARGEVVQALGALVQVGKVRVHQAPDGTPQLKKVDFIKYERVG